MISRAVYNEPTLHDDWRSLDREIQGRATAAATVDILRTVRDKLAHVLLGKPVIAEASGHASRRLTGYDAFDIPVKATEETVINIYTVGQTSGWNVLGSCSLSLVRLAQEVVPQLEGPESGQLRDCQTVNQAVGETVKVQCDRMGKMLATLLGVTEGSSILPGSVTPQDRPRQKALKRYTTMVGLNDDEWASKLEPVHL